VQNVNFRVSRNSRVMIVPAPTAQGDLPQENFDGRSYETNISPVVSAPALCVHLAHGAAGIRCRSSNR
jgi:hypothetical protein